MDTRQILGNKSIKIIDDKIIEVLILSSAFGCKCEKIKLGNDKQFVVKSQKLLDNQDYSAVYYEGKSLIEMQAKFKNIFPKVYHLENDFFIMDWIPHNNIRSKVSEKDLAVHLSKIHSTKNDKFGYEYDTPIGAIRQPCSFEKSWINFYGKKRLQMIFDIINKNGGLPSQINKGIEKIINNLFNYIPESETASLIHGDLWSGNILFNDGKLVGLIDPGIQFAHSELELSSLLFLNTVTDEFFNIYNDHIKIEKGFKERSGIYQLYYALLNVHLWDRSYIHQTENILKKYI